jgi:hypothetical protein
MACYLLAGPYGPLRKAPTEIIINIVIYTTYEDLQALCDATQSLTFENARYHRYDPRLYFRTLTSRPEVITESMKTTGMVLSGSRAAGYFYDKACRWDSDWNFYCSEGDVSLPYLVLTMMFILPLMSTLLSIFILLSISALLSVFVLP